MFEKRILVSTDCQLRAADTTAAGKRLMGYAARYGVLSRDLGGFRERIKSGAFERILSTNPDVIASIGHDPNLILGRTIARTLTLQSDSHGLRFNVQLPNTSYAKDLYENVRAGNIQGASFAFALDQGTDDSWTEEDVQDGDNTSRAKVRTIRNFKNLMDVSVCAAPAYPGTSVDARFQNVVAQEVRSLVQLATMPRTSSAWLAMCERLGVVDSEGRSLMSFEEAAARFYARRKRMLDEVMD